MMVMSTIISRLNKKLQAVEISSRCRRSKKNAASCIYGDVDQSKQQSPETKKAKKRVRFAETEPVIICVVGEDEPVVEELETEKTGVRVTVKLTKKEADRMLSRCSNGDFGDVACELMRMPAARVRSSVLAN